ncbi:GPO family capsid scaffolding protein [Enterobacter roggenkampii]|uniref:Capsid scaffolding protein n=1 Tax=Myoviridae sp. ctT3B27 TaxID=2826655 RepID=A0A8S5NA57_9CAUD|nr:GPO family capsid scaffolding protein [Enterobacter roggenkampii]MBK4124458.1 GPO family capsid scaffolding protein [Enterobacter roggenkampii]MBW4236800.1 GPO family capsid scaffolding protein [Enterobacter roggenkampii]DAD91582.1 MAG TPA: capsid scaffolding protein [Myoviridae sp. ctT3B27]
MAKKSKRFRIGVEGATTDGRTIERSWLEEMAASYDPAVYTALINMEHIKGYTPDSMFRRFGTVDKLETEVLTAPEALAGKMALYAWITPTDDLVAYTASLQKLFTSMEVNTKFSDTGKAYLVGLAVTDDPASLGTEMLQFSAQASANPLARRKLDKENLFSAAEETFIEFEDVTEKPSLFSFVKELLSRKQTTDDARFADVHSAVEAVAEGHHTLSGRVDDHASQMETYAASLKALEEQFTATQEELSELQEKLSQEDGRQEHRPFSTGGGQNSGELTNC